MSSTSIDASKKAILQRVGVIDIQITAQTFCTPLDPANQTEYMAELKCSVKLTGASHFHFTKHIPAKQLDLNEFRYFLELASAKITSHIDTEIKLALLPTLQQNLFTD